MVERGRLFEGNSMYGGTQRESPRRGSPTGVGVRGLYIQLTPSPFSGIRSGPEPRSASLLNLFLFQGIEKSREKLVEVGSGLRNLGLSLLPLGEEGYPGNLAE